MSPSDTCTRPTAPNADRSDVGSCGTTVEGPETAQSQPPRPRQLTPRSDNRRPPLDDQLHTRRASRAGRPAQNRSFSARGPGAVSLLNFCCERRGEVPDVGHMRDRGDYELVRAGVNLRIVQTLMRHESPATTAIYTDVNQEQQRAGIAALQWPAPARAA